MTSSADPGHGATAPRDRSSRKKLGPGAQVHYDGDGMFDRIARAVCVSGCIPRKELYESWEMAKRVRRHLRGQRIVDLACGHGLLGTMLALLLPHTPTTLVVDRTIPPSAARLAVAMEAVWPTLATRVERRQALIGDVELASDDIVVCAHGCGSLTDLVLDRAVAARASVAVLPCCSDHSELEGSSLKGWLDADLAIDVVRALRLGDSGYRVWTQTIPNDITPKNRLLIGRPTTT